MNQVHENPREAYQFVLDTFERKCDLSTASLTSDCRIREITDARKVFYKILRDTFGLSYVSIGTLFKKDHSTVVTAMKRHEELYARDKCYTKLFNLIHDDVTLRLKLQYYSTMKNGIVKLKTLYVSERESCDVIMKCFNSKLESSSYMLAQNIADEYVVFHGQPENISRAIAHEVVISDEKRYMLDVMKRNTDPILSILNLPIDRYYINYGTNIFDVKNDPEISIRSAINLFPNATVALIYIRLIS